MELPGSLQFVDSLYGAGNLTTVKAVQGKSEFVVQCVGGGNSLFSLDYDDYEKGESEVDFRSAKQREASVAAATSCFVKGRLERVGDAEFWIRPYLKRSLRDVVSLKERVDGAELSRIGVGITRALAALKQFDGGDHGRLSLGNVLLAESTPKVQLVDPAAPGKSGGFGGDRRALGLIIYQLVNREFVELDQSLTSVPEDEDWSRLGRNSERWKQLCSELLNPAGRYSRSSWAEICAELESLASGSSRRGKYLAVGVILLVLTGGGAYFFKWSSDVDEIVVDPATIQGKWQELVNNYFDWGTSFLLSEDNYSGDRSKGSVLDRFYDEERGLAVFRLISQVTGAGRRLLDEPETVRPIAMELDVHMLDVEIQKRIVVAHGYLTDLRNRIESWEVLARLRKSQKSFSEIGFAYGMRETEQLLGVISFEDGSLTLGILDRLRNEAAGLEEFQNIYESLREAIQQLRNYDRARFPELYAEGLETRLGVESDSPIQNIRDLSLEAGDFLEFWEDLRSRVDLETLVAAEEGFLEARIGTIDQAVAASIDQAVAASWREWARGYERLEPGLKKDARERLRVQVQEISSLTKQINELQDPGNPDATFSNEANELLSAFDTVTSIPAIELNRKDHEAAISRYRSAMSGLVGRAERRWAEVNPDIEARLQFLSANTGGLRDPLIAHWREYQEREIQPLSEDSFDSPLAFVRFSRAEEEKLSRFEAFQSDYLETLANREAEELSTTLKSPWQAEALKFYAEAKSELLSDWAETMGPALLQGAIQGAKLQRSLTEKRQTLQDLEVELTDYFKKFQETEAALIEWKLPEDDFGDQIQSLAQNRWAQSPLIKPALDRFRNYEDVRQSRNIENLYALARDRSQPFFLRFLAIQSFSEFAVLDPKQILELVTAIASIKSEMPRSLHQEWSNLLSDIWTRAFMAQGRSGVERQSLLSNYENFIENPKRLPQEALFLVEIGRSLEALQSESQLYLQQPVMLEEIRNGIRRAAAQIDDPRSQSLILELNTVDLNQKQSTYDEIGPVNSGWSIDNRTDERMVLTWKGRSLSFLRFESVSGDFFLSEEETSLGLISDWMTQQNLWLKSQSELPREWEIFATEAYSPFDDYRQGMRLWTIDRRGLSRGGLVPTASWFEVGPTVQDTYQAQTSFIHGDNLPSKDLPGQHLSARLARAFAESSGMALPTPEQWKTAVSAAPQVGNLWQSAFDERLSSELVDEIRLGSFYAENGIAGGGAVERRPLLLEPVSGVPGSGALRHLSGNVAEYLYEPKEGSFYVAGGSALSASASNWSEVHRLSPRQAQTAYADVGIRLAFDAPAPLPYEQFLKSLQLFWR